MVRRAALVPAIVGAVLAVVAFVLVVRIVLLAFQPAGGDDPRAPGAGDRDPAPRWAPPAEPPVRAESPGRGIASLADPTWVAETAARTGIPERALAAYAGAAIVKADAMPECGLSWSTLAGIGAVESDHGRHGGSRVTDDGLASPPIYGRPLDGNGTARIPDSDGGAIDGDPEHDRAVGPMQLIPQTWRNWHIDGNNDGAEDPQHIDDAVLAAANYLCRASIAQDTEAGWRAAVEAYNAAGSYPERVAAFAVQYAGG